jgi:biopolymer transport protein ExbD
MKTGGKRAVIGGINITPLTDVFLVLLIIMMLMPIIEMKELHVNIRPASTAETAPKETPKTFKMSVLADKFTVQKDDVDVDALAAALEAAAKEFPDGLVIEVSPESRHEQLAQALSSAKKAKIARVAVRRLPAPDAKDAKDAAPGATKDTGAAAKPAAKGK